MGNNCGCASSRKPTKPNAHVKAALQKIHTSLTTKFEPDTDVRALQTLQNIWSALLAPEPFARSSPLWKTAGFQGVDPVTDVRGGGLLAMQCLDAFATLHTMGLKAILQDLHDLEALGSNETFYPVSTTAIVLCAKLCDACGLMRQPAMLGAIKPEALTLLLQTPPPTPLAADLWSVLPDRGRRGGFNGLFALMLADFHVRFTLMRASYLQSQQIVDTVITVLEKRLAIVRVEKVIDKAPPAKAAAAAPTAAATPAPAAASAPAAPNTDAAAKLSASHTDASAAADEAKTKKSRLKLPLHLPKLRMPHFGKQSAASATSSSDPKSKSKAAAPPPPEAIDAKIKSMQSRRRSSIFEPRAVTDASRRFASLMELYSSPDEEHDCGASHSKDVHNLLTATEQRRITSVKILRKAIGIVALQKASRPELELSGTEGGGVKAGAVDAVSSAEADKNNGNGEGEGASSERHSKNLLSVVRAAAAASEADEAPPLTPMEYALPTSTALRKEKVQTDVVI